MYTTYVSGEYGGTPTAISVDAQGDVFVAGTTVSPDYPTTPSAYEPQYVASAVPRVSCFFIINCINSPPATGYLTEVNPTGTGLIYSSFFGGTQTDTINFFATTPNAIYLGGTASSADLPGFTGFPQPCLPQAYATGLSVDATEIGASRVAPGKVLAYEAFAGTLIATTGTKVVAFNPNAPQTPVSCILDSADLQPVTSIAPGELLSLFCEFSSGSPATPPSGQFPTSLDGVTVGINGIPSPLLYVAGEQINFQAPFEIAGSASANIDLASPQRGISDSLTLPIVASNPSAFLNYVDAGRVAQRPAFYRKRRLRRRTVAACLERGWLAQHVSESSPGGIGSDAVSGWPGSDFARSSDRSDFTKPRPAPGFAGHHGKWRYNDSLGLGGSGRDLRRMRQVNLQVPATESRGGNPLTLSAGGVPDAGCRSGRLGEVIRG